MIWCEQPAPQGRGRLVPEPFTAALPRASPYPVPAGACADGRKSGH
jgi:hypothetical protein